MKAVPEVEIEVVDMLHRVVRVGIEQKNWHPGHIELVQKYLYDHVLKHFEHKPLTFGTIKDLRHIIEIHLKDGLISPSLHNDKWYLSYEAIVTLEEKYPPNEKEETQQAVKAD